MNDSQVQIHNLKQAIENCKYLIASEADPALKAEYVDKLNKFQEQLGALHKAASTGRN